MADHATPVEVPDSVLSSWQEIVDILAEMSAIPAALIMRVSDPDIKVLLASRSRGNPYHPGDHERLAGSGLYCETVIRTKDRLLVPDALTDAHWKDNPDVKLHMISYLGLPILLPGGEPFGTICVLDSKANAYSPTVEKLLRHLRDLIQSQLAILHLNQALGDKNKRLVDYLAELQALRGIITICSFCKSISVGKGDWRPIEHYLVKSPDARFSHGICPKCLKENYPDFGGAPARPPAGG